MALRVLLADESSTIKKVFQLALQDYAVEVKPVALGVDVQAVAADFRPDIVFADILLQKKNGYEVCADLKADPQLNSIPVILMWSGFMELDRDKFEACGADGRLEKPFDVNQLRKIVQDLVAKTKTQSISNYLDFPDLPEINEENDKEGKKETNENPAESASHEADPDEDEFRPMSIPKMNPRFQVNISPDEDEAEFVMKSSSTSPKKEEEKSDLEALELEDDEEFSFHRPSGAVAKVAKTTPPPTRTHNDFHLSPEEMREIVEKLAPKIIEEITWKVVPDLASQIIEREIKNLLAEKDKEVSP